MQVVEDCLGCVGALRLRSGQTGDDAKAAATVGTAAQLRPQQSSATSQAPSDSSTSTSSTAQSATRRGSQSPSLDFHVDEFA